jgi:hypothetical protein
MIAGMITRRKILGWLGLAPVAAACTGIGTLAASPPPDDKALRELRSAWRYDFEGDHAYAAIRRCIGLRHLYRQGRISREEFQALLPHNLRAECSHLPELPWPDADDEAWADNVTHGWRQLPPDKQAWHEREFIERNADGRICP